MKSHLGLLLATFILAAMTFGALMSPPSVAAEDPAPDRVHSDTEGTALPQWLRYGVVACAAQTLGISVDPVKAGLRNGSSLAEIGIRTGVRPIALETGILRCERNLLERMVNAGELEPSEARRIFQFLTQHITRIINWSWDGGT